MNNSLVSCLRDIFNNNWFAQDFIFILIPKDELIGLHNLPMGELQFVFGSIKERKASTPHSAKNLRLCFILSVSGGEVPI